MLVFTGTQAGIQLIDRLTDYTEHVYAVVAPEYGKVPHPMGNMTLITSFLDEDGMQRWIDRIHFDLIVDGVSSDHPEASVLIRKAAEKNGIEYLKVVDRFNMISGISVCRTREELVEKAGSLMGNVLMDGADIFRLLEKEYSGRDSLWVLMDPDPDKIRELLEMGCPADHIICFGTVPSSEFMTVFFNEYNIAYYVMNGADKRGMVKKYNAIDHSNVRAFLLGDPSDGEGMTSDKAIRYIRKHFELSKS